MKLKSESYKRGAVSSSLLSISSKGLAFIMQMLVSFYYGANVGTDIFFYLYNTAFLIGGLVQSLNSSVLIPQAMQLRTESSPLAEMAFHNTFLYLFIYIGLVALLCIGVLAGTDFGVRLLMNFPADDVAANLTTCRLFFLLSLLLVVNLYLCEVIVSYKYFTAGLMCSFLMNLFSIVALLCFARGADISLLMYSSCAACLCYTCWLVGFMRRRLHWDFLVIDRSWLKLYRGRLLGFSLNQGVAIVAGVFPLYLLAGLQPGLVTIVNYAQKIVQAPLSWIQQFTAVLQIKLNELHAEGRTREMKRAVLQTAVRLCCLTLFTSVVTYLCSGLMAEYLYGWGKVPADIIACLSRLIAITTFSMPFVAVSLCFIKLYFTLRYIRPYIRIIITLNLLSCALYYLCITLWGEAGYAYTCVALEALTMLGIVGYLTFKRS